MKIIRSTFIFFGLMLAAVISPTSAQGFEKVAARGNYVVYVGTYTEKESKGIYAFRFDATTSHFTTLGLVAESTNPSFLSVHPNHRFLYAVNEITSYKGKSSGGVSAFAIDQQTGKLTFLNEVPSRGADPCYVALDKSGKYVLVANYTGGSVAVFPLLADGSLGEASAFVQHTGTGVNPERQEGPHAHSINLSPDNHFAIAADLGLDRLIAYHFNAAKGSIAQDDSQYVKVAPGAGPRHFAFHPSGRFGYVLNEMHSTVTAFSYDTAGGVLRELQTISTLPEGFVGRNDAAEVQVHPSGKFLYASNRGHDSIALFAIDAKKGALTLIEDIPTKGKEPRNFAIDPAGSRLYVANQNSGNIVVFRIDPKTGHLTPTGQVLEVSSPVCIRFLPIE